ncbi:hypothetical protein [Butyrivibrio sp. VCB2006]|uniref:hypothetical protein n=1 Tax=Butyrivibrio sp. VCB2006 TaxID=1280679 RepID=UPI00049273E3|nr:hypothetical protein [Butyrivibrio sp. VCB2006]
MQQTYTREISIERGPKTIDAVMLGGRYIDSQSFQIMIKSFVSASVLLGAGIISAILILM